MGLDSKNIVDLDINKEVLSNLIENDTQITKDNISKFLKDLGQIPGHAIHDELKICIEELIKNIDNEKIVKTFNFIVNSKQPNIDEILDKEQSYSQLDKKIKILEDEKRDLKQELNIIKIEKEQVEQQVTYLKAITTKDLKELVAFQHHIGLYANTAKNFTLDTIDLLNDNQNLNTSELRKLQKVILELDKIKIISKYITRDDFLSSAKKIEADIVEFIYNYIKSIYELTTNQEFNISINTNNVTHICKFEPIKVNIIIDNLLSNSKKEQIGAKYVNITFYKDGNTLLMEYVDDGKGLDSSIIDKNSIFEMGVTRTNGSGLGLYHIKELLTEMKSDITVEEQQEGIKFLIRFKI
jgi:signal transduction histidine kinase